MQNSIAFVTYEATYW